MVRSVIVVLLKKKGTWRGMFTGVALVVRHGVDITVCFEESACYVEQSFGFVVVQLD